MPNKFQCLYFNKIIAVIRSCKDDRQLENVRRWFDKVTYINKLPVELTNKIVKAYRAKKQQIKNGLAEKYNYHWAGNSKAVPRPNHPPV